MTCSVMCHVIIMWPKQLCNFTTVQVFKWTIYYMYNAVCTCVRVAGGVQVTGSELSWGADTMVLVPVRTPGSQCSALIGVTPLSYCSISQRTICFVKNRPIVQFYLYIQWSKSDLVWKLLQYKNMK